MSTLARPLPPGLSEAFHFSVIDLEMVTVLLGAVMLAVGSVRSPPPPPPSEVSYIPRPWVATRSTSFAVPGAAIAMSKIATTGRPVPNGLQVDPELVDAYTPMSVPMNRCVESLGSTTIAFTGTSGRPLFLAVQVGGVPFRLVVRHTCD